MGRIALPAARRRLSNLMPSMTPKPPAAGVLGPGGDSALPTCVASSYSAVAQEVPASLPKVMHEEWLMPCTTVG